MRDQDKPADGPGESTEAAAAPAGAAPARPVARLPRRLTVDLSHPFVVGFTVTVGALVAMSLAGAMASLSTVLVSVGVALFIALALDPLVRWLERHRLSRGLSIAVVFIAFAGVFAVVIALIVPVAVVQVSEFATAVPGYITGLKDAAWYQALVTATGQGDMYSGVLDQARSWLSNPANLLALGGGALAVGTGLVNAISGTLIVLVLTLYFLASLKSMQAAMVRLVPAHARRQVDRITDQISESVGGYVAGMVILAATNAAFSFILLSLLGVPFAALLAFLALLITMIPMVGPVLFWLLATTICFFTSWWVGLVFAAVYFAYMQVEAYVMTPRVMTKAVDIPGSLVLIGAMVGGTLLGLLGALVAVPVTASALLVLNTVYVPRQDARTVPDH